MGINISIVIPTCNKEKNKKFLNNCIKSIINQKNDLKFEIIIIDNAKSDNTIQKINDKVIING